VWLLGHIVPVRWRESLQGDLLEEYLRRTAAGLPAGRLWQAGAVVAIAGGLLVDAHRERLVDVTGVHSRGGMETMGGDFKHAMRGLMGNRGYAALAVATLALGIGANAAVFNVANWVLLRPLPGVRNPDQLVPIQLARAMNSGRQAMSQSDIDAIAAGAAALQGLAGLDSLDTANVAAGAGTASRFAAEAVTANYFDLLGVPIVAGRNFSVDEGRNAAGPPIAILSERSARRMFGNAAAAVGETVRVNGRPVQVVGVVMRGFHGLRLLGNVDIWMPGVLRHILLPAAYPKGPADITSSRGLYFTLAGRLKAGETRAVLDSQLQAVEQHLVRQDPPAAARFKERHFQTSNNLDVFDDVRASLGETFMILLGLAGILLTLACASVSNAILARTTSRTGEFATRLALGASRLALGRLVFLESLILCAGAGVMSAGIAWMVGVILEGSTVWPGMPPIDRAVPDWRVLIVMAGLSTLVAVITGLVPLWAVRRTDVAELLRGTARTQVPQRRRARWVLMLTETAASLLLLVGALLLVRSMVARLSVETGFDADRVLTYSVSPNPSQQQSDYAVHSELVRRTLEVRGVRTATLSFVPPFFTGMEGRLVFTTDHHPDDLAAGLNTVRTGFFDAIGLPFVSGRDFTESEVASSAPMAQAPVILVESLARRAFGRTDVAGESIVAGKGVRRQVVGVVRDTLQRRLADERSGDLAFQPYRPAYRTPWVTVVIGQTAPGAVSPGALRDAVAAVDPALPVFDVLTGRSGVERQFAREVLTSRLALMFAALAVAIAAVGLYGVVLRAVTERRRELAVRRALGATSADLVGVVTRDTVTPVVVGLAVGMLLSVWLSRFLVSELYGVSALDTVAYVAATLTVLVSLVAAAVPASYRVVRIDPAVVVRD
jgi:predicted permease